jgi:DNA-binding IclR family transcriptional regulator
LNVGRRKYPRPALETILEILRSEGKPIRAYDVAERTGINYNTVRGRLYELKRRGLAENTPEGWVSR